ncbi:PREDICTED: putative cell agglutination protein PB2C8.01 [Priapulus caudatus]|uniref:Cell agglutination protein PB2C8.01 n=1 Tax=Priapulus caudatus TaxID=37621 RepID=A0ABM1EKF6_PRICU|nr:PREDICTED: putative cell agglutination protein PB2C8.01 [Priapulus caudatus]
MRWKPRGLTSYDVATMLSLLALVSCQRDAVRRKQMGDNGRSSGVGGDVMPTDPTPEPEPSSKAMATLFNKLPQPTMPSIIVRGTFPTRMKMATIFVEDNPNIVTRRIGEKGIIFAETTTQKDDIFTLLPTLSPNQETNAGTGPGSVVGTVSNKPESTTSTESSRGTVATEPAGGTMSTSLVSEKPKGDGGDVTPTDPTPEPEPSSKAMATLFNKLSQPTMPSIVVRGTFPTRMKMATIFVEDNPNITTRRIGEKGIIFAETTTQKDNIFTLLPTLSPNQENVTGTDPGSLVGVTSNNPEVTMSTQPSGGTMSTQPSGGTMSTQPSGGTMSTQPSDGTMSTQPSDGTMSTQPSGGTMSTQPSGGTMSTQPSGGTMSTQPSGGTMSTQPSDGTMSTQPSSGTMSTQPSDGTDVNPIPSGMGQCATQAG